MFPLILTLLLFFRMNNPLGSQDQRINELELHAMHLRRDYESLNEVILEQGRKLDQLFEILNRLTRQMSIVEASMSELPDEKPPHY